MKQEFRAADPVVYTVFQEGVYRHDCEGVFDTLEAAVAAADAIAAADRDDNHDYVVVPWALNERSKTESNPIYNVCRSEALAKLYGARK
jgi:hypothetical protein